jgi:flagellar export protein FliJ
MASSSTSKIWEYLGNVERDKLSEELRSLADTEQELTSLEASVVKMQEMKNEYLTKLNHSDSAQEIAIVELTTFINFIGRIEEALRHSAAKKLQLNQDLRQAKRRCAVRQIEVKKYEMLGEKDLKASALKLRREEQKQADQQATVSWLQRESNS